MGNLCSIEKFKSKVILQKNLKPKYDCLFSQKYNSLCISVDQNYLEYYCLSNKYYDDYLKANDIFYQEYTLNKISYTVYENKNKHSHKDFKIKRDRMFKSYEEFYFSSRILIEH